MYGYWFIKFVKTFLLKKTCYTVTCPWARLHSYYTDPVKGLMYLIIVNVWIEAISTSFTTSATVIEELYVNFAQFELPDIIVTTVTDNCTHFVSTVFTAFLKRNYIKQITSTPYNLASIWWLNMQCSIHIVKQIEENHLRQHLHQAGWNAKSL